MTAPDNAVQAARERLEADCHHQLLDIHPSTMTVSTEATQAHARDVRTILVALTTAERDRDAAVKSASDGWRAAGEAQGKLEVSETAGVVESWRRRADEVEDERAQAWRDRREAEGRRDVAKAAMSEWRRRAEEAERLAGKRLEALRRPAGMQDVRLAVGEGRLTPLDIIAGCNAEFRRRAALTAAAEGTGDA